MRINRASRDVVLNSTPIHAKLFWLVFSNPKKVSEATRRPWHNQKAMNLNLNFINYRVGLRGKMARNFYMMGCWPKSEENLVKLEFTDDTWASLESPATVIRPDQNSTTELWQKFRVVQEDVKVMVALEPSAKRLEWRNETFEPGCTLLQVYEWLMRQTI